MEFKGTKERWEVEYVAKQESMRASVNNGSIDVWADINGVSIEEANANALLISKSPLLLKAIKDSINELREVGLNDMANYHEKLYNECVNL